jgi:hypothetical protein
MLLLRHRTFRTTLALVAVGALALVTACGSNKFEYVKNSQQKTYFKVPASWKKINQDEVNEATFGDLSSATAQARAQTVWTVAYDASSVPTGDHVAISYPAAEPVAHAMVGPIDEEARGGISLDFLRDIGLPVTTTAREQAAQDPTFGFSGFELLHDEVLTPSEGLHGVREVFNYRLPGGDLQTFDQTVLINNDASQFYLLQVHCSASCYMDRGDELQTVVTSFTVRSN